MLAKVSATPLVIIEAEKPPQELSPREVDFYQKAGKALDRLATEPEKIPKDCETVDSVFTVSACVLARFMDAPLKPKHLATKEAKQQLEAKLCKTLICAGLELRHVNFISLGSLMQHGVADKFANDLNIRYKFSDLLFLVLTQRSSEVFINSRLVEQVWDIIRKGEFAKRAWREFGQISDYLGDDQRKLQGLLFDNFTGCLMLEIFLRYHKRDGAEKATEINNYWLDGRYLIGCETASHLMVLVA